MPSLSGPLRAGGHKGVLVVSSYPRSGVPAVGTPASPQAPAVVTHSPHPAATPSIESPGGPSATVNSSGMAPPPLRARTGRQRGGKRSRRRPACRWIGPCQVGAMDAPCPTRDDRMILCRLRKSACGSSLGSRRVGHVRAAWRQRKAIVGTDRFIHVWDSARRRKGLEGTRISNPGSSSPICPHQRPRKRIGGSACRAAVFAPPLLVLVLYRRCIGTKCCAARGKRRTWPPYLGALMLPPRSRWLSGEPSPTRMLS
jgi:hypothetical protein